MREMAKPLWAHSASDLASAIARREVSSREVIEAHLERIDAVNPSINAVTAVLRESALAAADRADAQCAHGQPIGPLHGVPFTIKEEIDVKGSATTSGVVAAKDMIPEVDAPVVDRLRAAGAIPLARTNMPDLGMRLHTMSGLWGATLNPWNPENTPGGSSGGEAASLATGMTPLGVGSDIGGSLRNPSYCCGTTALKPTLGRLPHHYSLRPAPNLAEQLMCVCGPMARHVRDLRLATGIMAGIHPRDPRSVPAPLDGRALESPIAVAVTPEPPGGETHPSVSAGVRAAAAALRDAGYRVEEIPPPRLPEVYQLWNAWLGAEASIGSALILPLMCDEAKRFVALSMSETQPSLEGLAFCQMARHELGMAWSAFMAEWPLVLGPVWTQPPWKVGYDIAGVTEANDVIRQARLTVAVNCLGLPSVAQPVGVTDGLPRGVQLIGERFREDLCLDAAQAIEDRLGVITPIDPREAESG